MAPAAGGAARACWLGPGEELVDISALPANRRSGWNLALVGRHIFNAAMLVQEDGPIDKSTKPHAGLVLAAIQLAGEFVRICNHTRKTWSPADYAAAAEEGCCPLAGEVAELLRYGPPPLHPYERPGQMKYTGASRS